MKRQVKIFIAAISIFVSMLLFVMPAMAGNLQPPAGPDDAASAMYTLEDLHNRLATGAEGSKRTGDVMAPPAVDDINGTGKSIDEVMILMPEMDNSNGATQSEVVEGTTFWGLSNGNWGKSTGTMRMESVDPEKVECGALILSGDKVIYGTYCRDEGYYCDARFKECMVEGGISPSCRAECVDDLSYCLWAQYCKHPGNDCLMDPHHFCNKEAEDCILKCY